MKIFQIVVISVLVVLAGCLPLSRNTKNNLNAIATIYSKDVFVVGIVADYHSKKETWPSDIVEAAKAVNPDSQENDMLKGVVILSSDQGGCVVLIRSEENFMESRIPSERKIEITRVDKKSKSYKGQYVSDVASGPQMYGTIGINISENNPEIK